MDRSKLVAIITGAISIILAVAYLLLVQLLDFRGEMLPAPQDQLPQSVVYFDQSSISGQPSAKCRPLLVDDLVEPSVCENYEPRIT